MELSLEEAKVLIAFIYAQGYISHEFHPEMYPLTKRLEGYLDECSKLEDGRSLDK